MAWPDKLLIFVAANIQDLDEESCLIRKTFARLDFHWVLIITRSKARKAHGQNVTEILDEDSKY